jgi:siroheme synthase
MTAPRPGTVYLVGAGPGDPELLTLKAHRLLSQCDALVYDSLVPKALLDLVPEHCERHFVGKRRGHHSVPQPSTNAVLVELASRHRLIVRLKGGDPFLFGRGGEEAAHLVRHGVPVEVVPGVTAGIAAPAYLGIPVTHRRAGSSVTFVTGHEEIDKGRPGAGSRGDADSLLRVVVQPFARSALTAQSPEELACGNCRSVARDTFARGAASVHWALLSGPVPFSPCPPPPSIRTPFPVRADRWRHVRRRCSS